MVKIKEKSIVIIFILVIIITMLSFKLINKNNTNNNIIIIKDFSKLKNEELKVIKENYYKQIQDNNYLFLGDSITDFYDLEKYYPGLPVVNSGINGDKVYDILNNMKERVYDYNPTKIFLLIGTNQIHKESEDKVYNSIVELIEEIRENRPHAKIFVESIYPVNNTLDKHIVKERDNKKIKYVNRKLEDYCQNNNYLTYIDLYKELKDDKENLNKEYTEDGLHLNEKGYEVVTNIIRKYIIY